MYDEPAQESAATFNNARHYLEQHHVIRSREIHAAIAMLTREDGRTLSYLLEIARQERRDHGWPYWALLCGALARLGGEQGRMALVQLANDPAATRHARHWAEKALLGDLSTPDD